MQNANFNYVYMVHLLVSDLHV